MKLKSLFGAMMVTAACVGGAGAAYAANPDGLPDVLSPGGTNFMNANPLGLDEQFAFTGPYSILASSTNSFSGTDFTGSLFSQVIAGDTHNPLGGLEFVYQISILTGNDNGIHRMTVNGYEGSLATDVGYIQGIGSNINPTSVDRSLGLQTTIGWNFLPSPTCFPGGCFTTPGQIGAGHTSAQLIVYTSDKFYQFNTAQFIDGSVAVAQTFSPAPEPETYAMMLSGLGLLGFISRRRNGTKRTT